MRLQDLPHHAARGDRFSIDFVEDVTLLEAGLLRLFSDYFRHINARMPHPVLLRFLGIRKIQHIDSYRRSAFDSSIFYELFGYLGRRIDRNSEAKPLYIGTRGFGYHDTDQVAASVKESAAGIARVDGCICLKQVHSLAIYFQFPVQGADDTGGCRSPQLSQRIAQSYGHIADLQGIAVPIYHRIEIFGFDLQNGYIRYRIGAD